MAEYKLTYFDGRGRVEIIRYIFAVAGVDYEDIRFKDLPEWYAKKPEFDAPFGQLPVIDIDGVRYCQTLAIARYLANKYDLSGKDPIEKLRSDMIVDCCIDVKYPITQTLYEQDEEKKAAMKKKYEEEQLPDMLLKMEKLLTQNQNGDGWFVGDQLTWADLAFLDSMSWCDTLDVKLNMEAVPKLQALLEKVKGHPKVMEWIEKRPKTQY